MQTYIAGGARLPNLGCRSWQALNKNIPPTPKPRPSKTKKDGGGGDRRADVSRCGSDFIYARAVLMEREAL